MATTINEQALLVSIMKLKSLGQNPKSFKQKRKKKITNTGPSIRMAGYAGCQRTMEKMPLKFWKKNIFQLAKSSYKCKSRIKTFSDISDTKMRNKSRKGVKQDE